MSASMGPVTIGCPACGERVPVPCQVVHDSPHSRTVLVRMDYTPARQHFTECAGKPEATTKAPAKVPAKLPAYVHPGTRACVMCGMSNATCMAMLQGLGVVNDAKVKAACCNACGQGDTHPVPRGTMPCAQWGAEHGAPTTDAPH